MGSYLMKLRSITVDFKYFVLVHLISKCLYFAKRVQRQLILLYYSLFFFFFRPFFCCNPLVFAITFLALKSFEMFLKAR